MGVECSFGKVLMGVDMHLCACACVRAHGERSGLDSEFPLRSRFERKKFCGEAGREGKERKGKKGVRKG